MTNQIRKCLHSELERTLSSDKNPSLNGAQLLSSNEGTNSSTSCEANAAKNGLIKHLDVFDVLETRVWDAVCRGAGFGNDEITVAEIATEGLQKISV